MNRIRPIAMLAAQSLALGGASVGCRLDVLGRAAPDEPDAAIVDATVVSEAGRPNEAGGDAPGWDAGSDAWLFPSDPGLVACVGGPCRSGSTRCCSDNSGTRCLATSTSSCSGSEINCDETADCGAGICCLGPDNAFDSVPSTYCRTACATGYARVCKSSAECGTSACLAINCRGRAFGTCGGVQPQQCL
jgi:hypothetical protein